MKKSLIVASIILVASLLAFAATLAGTWNIQGTASGGPQKLILSVSGPVVTGTLDGASISGGGTSGTSFWFTAVRGGTKYQYKGTLNGDFVDLFETQGSANNSYKFTRAGS